MAWSLPNAARNPLSNVFEQDGIHQIYDDILPYHEFSVRLPQSAIPDLDKILKSITPDEARAEAVGAADFLCCRVRYVCGRLLCDLGVV